MTSELLGLALATLLVPLVWGLPGIALVRLFERAGFDAGSNASRAGWAALLAVSLLPAADAIAVRFAGLAAVTAAHLVLGASALPDLAARLRARRGPLPRAAWVLPLWWLIVAFAYVDVERDGGLHQSLLVLDLVKHAAVTTSIVQTGLPLRDPFFLRDGPSGYYYYYYLLPAMVRWLGGALYIEQIDARVAFVAAAFWTAAALPAAMWRIATDARLVPPGKGPRMFAILTGLCFVGGADLLVALARAGLTDGLEAVSTSRSVMMTGLWVGHHFGALIACFTGALLLNRMHALDRSRRADRVLAGLLAAAAGLAFASAFGMSAWTALAAAPILPLWLAVLVVQSEWPASSFAALAIVAAVAVAASSFQFVDLLIGRAHEGVPVAFRIRPWLMIDGNGSASRSELLLALAPVTTLIEFGVFALGTVVFLRARSGRPRNAMATLLVVSAVIGLF